MAKACRAKESISGPWSAKKFVYRASSPKLEKSAHATVFHCPMNMAKREDLVFARGNSSLEEMIASTDRGLLVTRLWVIRESDAYEKIMTA